MKTNLICLFGLLLCFVCADAQKAEGLAEYKKVTEAYNKSVNISYDVEVYAFETARDKTPELVGKGYSKKGGGLFHSKFQENEVIMNGGNTLLINHDQKSIDYYDVNLSGKKIRKAKQFSVEPDSLLKMADSLVEYQGMKDGRKLFSIHTKGSIITQTDMYVDPATNFISKMVYYYASSTEEYEVGVYCVVVYFKNISLTEVPKNWFSFKEYIKVEGKKYSGINTCKNYRVNYYNY